MSTPVFQTFDLRFETCLKLVIMDKKIGVPAISKALKDESTNTFLGRSPMDPYPSFFYFPPNIVPVFSYVLSLQLFRFTP